MTVADRVRLINRQPQKSPAANSRIFNHCIGQPQEGTDHQFLGRSKPSTPTAPLLIMAPQGS